MFTCSVIIQIHRFFIRILFSFEPRVFLAFPEFQPQNIPPGSQFPANILNFKVIFIKFQNHGKVKNHRKYGKISGKQVYQLYENM